jgi:hypothetical protein
MAMYNNRIAVSAWRQLVLKFPPSAHNTSVVAPSSSSSQSITSSTASSSSSQSITSSLLQRRTGAISAGISHIYTYNRLICVDSLQGGDIHDDDGEDVDHDTIRSNFELDSKE